MQDEVLPYIVYSQVHNKRGIKLNGGRGFKEFEKLSNGGSKSTGWVGTKYKKEETKLGLSLNTLLVNFFQNRYFWYIAEPLIVTKHQESIIYL